MEFYDSTSTGELVLNRRIPFVIVVLLVVLPGVPVLSLLLQVHRLPRVAVLLPVPLLARRRRIRTGGMFYADATLDTMVVARPENRERVFEDAVRRFVNRLGFLRRRASSTRQSSASPVAPQRAHRYSSWVSSSSLTRWCIAYCSSVAWHTGQWYSFSASSSGSSSCSSQS